MLDINEAQRENHIAFLNLGFRPLFFSASLSSVLLMLGWFLIYQFGDQATTQIPAQYWHAHEMIFAYTMAVVVGFLLTAVKNWTGVQTIHGRLLLMLLMVWLIARFLPFVDGFPLILQAIIDTAFLLFSAVAVAYPVVKVRMWKNFGVVSKVMLMAIAHIVYYLGLLGILEHGVQWGLYGAFYLILALIFVMARRVVPFFIERGVDSEQPLKNSILIDAASMILFLAYAVFEVFWQTNMVYMVSFLLFVLHSIRLYFWHHSGIWKTTLLWSLYLAYLFLAIGFGLKTGSYFVTISPYLVIHCFALGIGMFSIAMMSRVTLGHTGRNVYDPPRLLFWVFSAMVFAFVFRVILPIMSADYYTVWIGVSQLLWSCSFLLFLIIYTPMLFAKRLDGKFG